MNRFEHSKGLVMAASAALLLALLPLGCGLLTGSSDGPGGSVVAGNVSSSSLGRHAAGNAVSRSTVGGGVLVTVEGTGLTTTTASDGSFSFSSVPAGMVTITFTYEGVTTSVRIEVPENSRVTLRDITLNAAGVTIGSVEIEEIPGNNNSNSNSNSNSNTNTNSNSNTNTNTNTNTNSNSNTNTNTNTNTNSNSNTNTNSNSNTNTNSNSNTNSL